MLPENYKHLSVDIDIDRDDIVYKEDIFHDEFQQPLFPRSGIHFFQRQQEKKNTFIDIQPVDSFLSKEEQQYFKQELLNEKQEMIDTLHNKQSMPMQEEEHLADEIDIATVSTEKELQWDVQERRQDRLQCVEAALQRINRGTYGYCVDTGEPISLGRLKADPSVSLSVEAQANREES